MKGEETHFMGFTSVSVQMKRSWLPFSGLGEGNKQG